jgi:hypothetical protein
MKEKHFKFEFCKYIVGEVEKLLLSIHNDKPPAFDNLDGKLLRMVADSIATPIWRKVFILKPGGNPKSFRYPRVVKWPLLV